MKDSDFLNAVSNPNKATFVYFGVKWCNFCKEFSPKWDELTKQLSKEHERVKLIAVDAESISSISKQLNITSFPTVVSFLGNAKKRDYFHNTKNLDELKKFIIMNTRKKFEHDVNHPIKELTTSDIGGIRNGRWLVLFYLPGCGACESISPKFKSSAEFSTKHGWPVQFAQLNCGLNWDVSQKLNISGFPTLISIDNEKVMGIFAGDKTEESILHFTKNTLFKKSK